ncbi:MAG: FprA family A-type flavoprotein [Candidatus Brocadiia bacterium]|jgi:flavorubredoxin|nr:FprA family A-type flavoprotein [Candidatus Brocadiia bacterium]
MLPIEVDAGVHWIGVNERTLDLFEGLWPVVREGVSYNAYLIEDESTAIIDLSKGTKGGEFFDQVGHVTDVSAIDYVIINHLEPDHAGLLATLRALNPGVTIICAPNAKEMLETFYNVTKNVRAVRDGESLSLGRTELQFFHAPFIHWPETMVTYDTGRKILFSCDAFGGYGALQGGLFDDECGDLSFYERESLRYYANIVAKFSKPVLQAIKKLGGLDIRMIAPSHGLVWRADPGRIVELYRRWASYATGAAEPGITLVYGSMYGFTEQMMNAVAVGIRRTGVPLDIFDAGRAHVSYILPSLLAKSGVMIGAPTYEGALFPPVAQALGMAATKSMTGKKVARFGSYGWRGGAQRCAEKIFESLKWELVESFEFCGKPSEAELSMGIDFGARFAEVIAAN